MLCLIEPPQLLQTVDRIAETCTHGQHCLSDQNQRGDSGDRWNAVAIDERSTGVVARPFLMVAPARHTVLTNAHCRNAVRVQSSYPGKLSTVVCLPICTDNHHHLPFQTNILNYDMIFTLW